MKMSKMKASVLACVIFVASILAIQFALCIYVIIGGNVGLIILNVFCVFVTTLSLISIIRTYKSIKRREEGK